MYRLFVAIDLPEEIKKELGAMCFGIPGAKWVEPEQLHLTLRFIGEVDGGVLADIRETLEGVRGEPFTMRLKGFGHFPPRQEPRVLWVGVDAGEDLVRLRNRIENGLVRAGIEPEHRKFAPHITVARLKETPLRKLTNFFAGNALYASPAFEVTEFHLYSSTLSLKGAIHTREESYLLIRHSLES
ncbi:MAG: RNA 2',3'-cyclic phosphodiesterase [Desulfobacteraceae bacterium]|nr:RNA 2',3'-cyclic phosphodiesterase [Desulfobacteraceae bacterium]